MRSRPLPEGFEELFSRWVVAPASEQAVLERVAEEARQLFDETGDADAATALNDPMNPAHWHAVHRLDDRRLVDASPDELLWQMQQHILGPQDPMAPPLVSTVPIEDLAPIYVLNLLQRWMARDKKAIGQLERLVHAGVAASDERIAAMKLASAVTNVVAEARSLSSASFFKDLKAAKSNGQKLSLKDFNTGRARSEAKWIAEQLPAVNPIDKPLAVVTEDQVFAMLTRKNANVVRALCRAMVRVPTAQVKAGMRAARKWRWLINETAIEEFCDWLSTAQSAPSVDDA